MADRLELYPVSAKQLREAFATGEFAEEAQSYWEDYLWDGDTFESEDEPPDELWERLCGELSQALEEEGQASGECAYAIASAAFGLRSGERTVCAKAEVIDEGIGDLRDDFARNGTLGLTLGERTAGVVSSNEWIKLGCVPAAKVASLAEKDHQVGAEDFNDHADANAVRDAIRDALSLAAKEKLDLFVVRRNY